MAFDFELFLGDLSSFIVAASQRELAATQSLAEQTILEIDNYVNVLWAIIQVLQTDADFDGRDDSELKLMIEELLDSLQEILSRWLDIEVGIDPDSPCIRIKAEKEHVGGRGRPKYIIKHEQLHFLRDLRFTWTQIASLFGVSRRTLYNIRTEFGMTGPHYSNYTVISDADLQEVVRGIKIMMPDVGQNMMKGLLEAKGIYISMIRIRECIAEVDPVNTAMRWALPRTRRVYSVPHPNYLWHLDGNHKLIRYNIVCYVIVVTYNYHFIL